MLIDRNSQVSMYTQIANHLETAIKAGELKPNQKLPTEMELMEKYNVSRMTARLALQSLDEKGLVVRKRRKGTFVNDSILFHEIGSMEAFYDSFVAKNLVPKLIEMKVIETPQDVVELMGETFKETLYYKRHYLRDQMIFGFSQVYLPIELAQTISWNMAEKSSGYSLLSNLSGKQPKYAKLSIRAFPCSEEYAQTLDIEPGDPILRLSRTSFSSEDKPIEHFKLYLRSEISEFNITVSGNFPISGGVQTTD